jgi:hypothetical protein
MAPSSFPHLARAAPGHKHGLRAEVTAAPTRFRARPTVAPRANGSATRSPATVSLYSQYLHGSSGCSQGWTLSAPPPRAVYVSYR